MEGTEKKAAVLVVDDDPGHRTMLQAVLGEEGYDVTVAAGGAAALEELGRRDFRLVLLDIRMSGMSGLEVLGEIQRQNPKLPVVMMTAHASVETAVEALKVGARDYLTKPLDTAELSLTIDRILEHSRLESENRELRERLKGEFSFGRLLSASAAMREIVDTLRRVSSTDATLLVLGESGTGKELVANAVHEHSSRSRGPFTTVNCAAIPEQLLESELFGYEKGAFTGAAARKEGKITAAHGGTLFLDEIAEMPATLQAKILRVIQEREVQPLGGSRSLNVDVRILAATNRDLEEEVRSGRFREDLFYRLNVVSVSIPPLRERREDIPMLARTFLEAFRKKHGREVKAISPEAMDVIAGHDWPGNVRELENTIERAVVLCRGEVIGVEDLPAGLSPTADPSAGQDPFRAGMTLREAEVSLIKLALGRAGGNKTQAAKSLGISRQTLLNRLKDAREKEE